MLTELCLKINTEKTVCMVFGYGRNRQTEKPKILLYEKTLRFVDEVKYLGVIIMDNLNNAKDIDRCNTAFLRRFWSLFRNFSYADLNVFKLLFNYHCTDFYGSITWANFENCKGKLHALGVAYHKALKKMLNVPWSSRNHIVCEALCLQTFEHLINRQLISFLFHIYRNNSQCVMPLKYFLLHDSELLVHVTKTFQDKYGLIDIFSNDLQAIYSRINFVQRYETSMI